MQLMSANNYGGGTVLAGGTLLAADPAALGSSSSPVTFSGGSLALRSGQATATFPQSLTTSPTGNTNVDLGPAAFTTGAAALGVALNVTGTGGSSWSLPSLTLQNSTSSPTAIHNAVDVIVNGRVLMAAGASNGDVLKDGAGTLTFAGTLANTYTGATTVSGGALVLNKSPGVIAIPGDLTVINGATVRLNASGQIASSAHVTLNNVPAGALLDLNGNNNTFNNGVNFVAGGTLSSGAGIAILGGNVQSTGTAGSAVIAGNLNLGSAARTFSVANGSAVVDMSVSANISGGPSAGAGLIKTGPGLLLLSGVNTYTGDTIVAQGTLVGTIPPNSALSIEDGASASIAEHEAGAKTLLQLGGLSFLHNGTGRFDLANNDMIVRGASAGDFFGRLKSGFNAHLGDWNGASGIASSSAAADTQYLMTLGYRQSDGNQFDGSMTSSNDVLISYTYFGDADLSGTLNGADYQQIDLGFGSHLTGWSNGDFNYDGVVDGADYALIDNTFNQIAATGAAPLAIIASSNLSVGSASTSSVPEPGDLAVVGLWAILAGRRHRRAGR
jgi:fibronectin-binding autotransporter adhesin